MDEKSPRVIELDGRTINSLQEFYDWAFNHLNLPDYFGNNLDALEECLNCDVEGPLKIIWNNSSVSEKAIGEKFCILRKIIVKDLPKNRPDIQFVLK